MSEKIESQTVTMAHGAGGKQTSELIDKVFAAHFANPDLTVKEVELARAIAGKAGVEFKAMDVSFIGNLGKNSMNAP